MISLYTFHTPSDRCGYLPERTARMRYEIFSAISPDEYAERMKAGWRRFGFALFRNDCPTCQECRSIRVDPRTFNPSATQKRVFKLNDGAIQLKIGSPSVSDEKLALHDKFHAHQSEAKGWPYHGPKDESDYLESFVDNPYPIQEWCYYLEGRLIGVGYVDPLPVGLSAIYFYYDPDEAHRSMGVWNVLSVIAKAKAANAPHVYLGFHVRGCSSLEYKAKYRPNEVLVEGVWQSFL